MDWRHWRKAAERGLLCAINPDAHETAGLEDVRAGVNAARKGWLTKRTGAEHADEGGSGDVFRVAAEVTGVADDSETRCVQGVRLVTLFFRHSECLPRG